MSLSGRFGVFSERRGRHAERALEGELRYFHQPTKQRRGASRMTHSRRMLALADLHAGGRQQDQSLEEHARWAASIHNLPKTFRRERRATRAALVSPNSFRSTLPRRERPEARSIVRRYVEVSIHAPAKGA